MHNLAAADIEYFILNPLYGLGSIMFLESES